MNIIDLFIILFLVLGAFIGFKQGFTKSVVNFLGIIVVIILSYLLKNPVSEILMSFGPFFNFGGIIKGITVLNIALYEVVAFALVFSILTILLKIVLLSTGIFETILKFTVILGIPSKILGSAICVLKHYIIIFFALYLLSMPNFVDVKFINNSNFKDPILKNTPVLSNIASSSLKVLDEFKGISDKYTETDSNNEFNLETLDLFLKYKVVTKKEVIYLEKSGKIKINGIEKVLNKY